jgi:hypothetical protein
MPYDMITLSLCPIGIRSTFNISLFIFPLSFQIICCITLLLLS